MREIKFRAWDKENGVMIDSDSLALEEYAPLVDLLNHDSIMQYTGLKDKNGTDIYEGDICTAEQMLFPLTGTRTGIVKYHDGAYLLEDFDGKDGDFLFSETAETTVIGNIYENPEILTS